MNNTYMRVINTPFGYKTVTNDTDIYDILKENNLYELSELIKDSINTNLSDYEEEISDLKNELDDISEDKDEYESIINDSKHDLYKLINELKDTYDVTDKGLNKLEMNDLIKKLNNIYDNLNDCYM